MDRRQQEVLIPSQPRTWTDEREAGEACSKSGKTVAELALLCGCSEAMVKRWIFIYQTGAYKPTTPAEYAVALRRLLKNYPIEVVAVRIERSIAWITRILEENPEDDRATPG